MNAEDLLDEFARQTIVPFKDWESYRKFCLLSDRKGQVAELERLAELAEKYLQALNYSQDKTHG